MLKITVDNDAVHVQTGKSFSVGGTLYELSQLCDAVLEFLADRSGYLLEKLRIGFLTMLEEEGYPSREELSDEMPDRSFS